MFYLQVFGLTKGVRLKSKEEFRKLGTTIITYFSTPYVKKTWELKKFLSSFFSYIRVKRFTTNLHSLHWNFDLKSWFAYYFIIFACFLHVEKNTTNQFFLVKKIQSGKRTIFLLPYNIQVPTIFFLFSVEKIVQPNIISYWMKQIFIWVNFFYWQKIMKEQQNMIV